MRRWQRMMLAGGAFLLLSMLAFRLAQVKPMPEAERILFWNCTESLPAGFYVRIPASVLLWREPAGSLRDGDYVVYQPEPETAAFGAARGWMQEDTLFLKRVGAVDGECWSVTGDLRFLVNGEYLGPVFLEDREGRPMPHLPGCHTVPTGMFLPVGDAPRSFDGRYTGPVATANIRAIVFPLLTGIHW